MASLLDAFLQLFPRNRRARALLTEYSGLVTAIRRSQAVIEFTLDGQVLAANENFLTLMGSRPRFTAGR